MHFRLVRPMQRKGSRNHQFVQRIPADVKARAAGLLLQIPVGDDTVPVTVSANAGSVRLSLRASEPSEVKARQGAITAYLEQVWRQLRADEPEVLSHRQIVAMSRAAYAWPGLAEEDPEYGDAENAATEEVGGVYAATLARMLAGPDPLGRSPEEQAAILADKLLARHGKVRVASQSRELLATEILRTMRDGLAAGDRQTQGDYSPDPKLARFPEVEALSTATGPASLTRLVEEWWVEAQAGGRTLSTYESYKGAISRLVAFLGHDNAATVTRANLVAFKDHRLKQGASPKTVGDSDLAAIRSVYKWAVANLKVSDNPALGVAVTRTRVTRSRPKSFSPEEAAAILRKSQDYKAGREAPKLAAAKRWVPWLCAYTGARLGEMVQLRKQDVRRDREDWIATITPEAGTVKDKEVREVVLHADLIGQGFATFVEAAPDGYLFLTPRKKDGEMRGVWKSVKNRIREFAREVVKDKDVAPNHAWRHLFKTIGREAGIADSVLDGICGHAAKTVGGSYGGVTLKAQREAMAKFPRFDLGEEV